MDYNRKQYFSGDIIITDPAYFISDYDWDRFCNGEFSKLSEIGFGSNLMSFNYYGDWSCVVIDNRNNAIGKLCSDSGMVCVCLLSEVNKYNPEYDYHKKPWTATVIKDFNGYIKFNAEDVDGEIELIITGSDLKKDFSFKIIQYGI